MIEQVVYKESVYVNDYPGDSHVIQSHIDHILSFDKGRSQSNRGGYQSNFITFGFKDLIQFAINSLALINKKAQLASFWLNINQGENYNDLHVHHLQNWSAIYYHKVCCEKATTNFHHLVPSIVFNKFEFTPVEKRMVFFNGMLPHSVSPCDESNHERITLAFNFRIL
tara:strand:- start:54 stop:557 length:504 start_codon:yes stop_codon:yes gene_type:complete